MSTIVDYNRRFAVGTAAQQEADAISCQSRLPRLENQIHQLNWADIQLGTTIGYGGFSQVFQCALHCEHDDQEYALKCLHPTTMLKLKSFKTGAVDLVLEGDILSRISHPNVIRLHGVCSNGPLHSYMESDRGYFLVLDLLQDTLSHRLEQYRQQPQKGFSLRSSRTNSSVLERVQSVALGVARGMEFLHKQGVVLRDLKPDNVGFDKHGTPKLFDLGFAREVHTLRPKEVAGSLRYMAPEVALGKSTQLSSDVYSFGVLLWELCTLEKPYKHLKSSREDFMDQVIVGGWRHSTSTIPSTALRKLIKECWQTDPKKRPTFTKIVKVLIVELKLLGLSSSSTTTSGLGHHNATAPKQTSHNHNHTASTPSLSSHSLKRMTLWSKTATKLSNSSKRLSNSSLGVLRNALGAGRSSHSFNKSLSRKTADTVISLEDYIESTDTMTTTNTATSNNSSSRRDSNGNATFRNLPAGGGGSNRLQEKILLKKNASCSKTLSLGAANINANASFDPPTNNKEPSTSHAPSKSKHALQSMHESCPELLLEEVILP